MSEYTPTVGELRQAYVEASGASMAQESYYAEQLAEFERGIARVKAEAWDEGVAKGSEVGADAITLNPMHANPYRDEAGL